MLDLAIGGVRLHVVDEEVGSTFHNVEILGEELFVACVEIMLPDVGGQPCSSCGEHAPGCTVNRTCDTPEVCVMMGHPSFTAIHLLSRDGTCLTEVSDHREEGLLCLCEVTHQGRPVVHLGIDVDGVFRIPGCIDLVVPDTLQIGWLSARLRGGDEQVTAVLHHERHHVEVTPVESDEAAVCGQVLIPVMWQCQADAVILILVFLEVTAEDLLIAAASEKRERLDVLTGRIAADIVVIHVVGSCGDIQCGSGRIADGDTLLAIDDLTVREHLQTTFRVEAGRYALMIYTLDDGCQLMAIDATGGFQRTVKADVEGQDAFLTGLNPHDNRIVGL